MNPILRISALILLFLPITAQAMGFGVATQTSDWSWVEEAKEWQSAVGAFVGLFVILLGAMANAMFNRWRDDRLRRQEAQSLAIALFPEVEMNVEAAKQRGSLAWSFKLRGNSIQERDVEWNDVLLRRFRFYLRKTPSDRAFHDIGAKIGLLPSHLTQQISTFYIEIADYSATYSDPEILQDLAFSEGTQEFVTARPDVKAVHFDRIIDQTKKIIEKGEALSKALQEFSQEDPTMRDRLMSFLKARNGSKD